jgi:hypothetical protein
VVVVFAVALAVVSFSLAKESTPLIQANMSARRFVHLVILEPGLRNVGRAGGDLGLSLREQSSVLRASREKDREETVRNQFVAVCAFPK